MPNEELGRRQEESLQNNLTYIKHSSKDHWLSKVESRPSFISKDALRNKESNFDSEYASTGFQATLAQSGTNLNIGMLNSGSSSKGDILALTPRGKRGESVESGKGELIAIKN